MALAKADLTIGERYAGLVEDETLREAIWARIRAEYERTRELVLAVTGQARLLDRTPVLQRSIERRNPYVDPLSFIQVELLRRLRPGRRLRGARAADAADDQRHRGRPAKHRLTRVSRKSSRRPDAEGPMTTQAKHATRAGRLRALAITGATVLALLAATGTANATTKIVPDAGWQSFITGGGIDGASTAGPWTFTTTAVTKVTVTDAFCRGDEFRVLDKDVLLGDTSEVASDFPACPFELFFPPKRELTQRSRTQLQPRRFFWRPGTHAIEFENKALWSDTSSGTGAFFRVDSVAVTKNDCQQQRLDDLRQPVQEPGHLPHGRELTASLAHRGGPTRPAPSDRRALHVVAVRCQRGHRSKSER